MTAYEIFQGLQSLLKEEIPQAEFREGYGYGPASRLPLKPTAVGQVGSESTKEGKWEARLDYLLYLPRGCAVSAGEAVLAAMCQAAGENFSTLSGVKRGAFSPDKATGLLAAACSLEFTGESEGAPGRTIQIGGVGYKVSGWEITAGFGEELTAIGENEPFAVLGGPTYTVELQGLDITGLERLAGFTVQLGDEIFQRCRWKTLNSAKRRAVFLSNQADREEA